MREQPGEEEEVLTSQAEPPRPEPDPDDTRVGAASDTESEQSSAASGDHNLTGVNPPGGVALRHPEARGAIYKPRLGRPAKGSAS